MEFSVKALLLTAESKPYNFEGNVGTSHRIRFAIKGEIFVCKSTGEQVSAHKQFEGKEGVAVLKLVSRKEAMALELVSFEASE